jgi:hypothetical protein
MLGMLQVNSLEVLEAERILLQTRLALGLWSKDKCQVFIKENIPLFVD